MALFADNLRYLRGRKKLSQQKVADDLRISRGQYQKYEDGNSEAPYQILIRISQYYNVTTDLLLTADLTKVSLDGMIKIGQNRMLLPVMVDAENNDAIEIVPQAAKAGYTSGYADPEYIGNLPIISLPFLGAGKHRAFPVEGDSMPPHEDGSFIVGKYVEGFGEIRDGKTYIVVTKDDGIVYKRLNKNGKNALVLHSDNSFYEPYQVKASDIIEIWEYVCNIGRNDQKMEHTTDTVTSLLIEMRKELREVKAKIQ
ncbi:XRE family transcriptional regulator [Flavobacterium limnosediminis]|uniref:XRE family transcriptional regulator n=1 Tax=Flavobacterium limnosediminis TaxID=1401027 RepID=UPI000550F77E|nr:helix-turn-helix domain-containing protein [Flavobacterium limnosediminis]